MSAIAYMRRAVNRAFQKGPIEMLRYSSHVAAKAVLAAYIDLRYGGKISKDRLDINNRGKDGNFVLCHSDYYMLRDIFRREPIKPDDVLCDVGCGDGRVINYWLSLGLKNKIYGYEIDQTIGNRTKQRLSRYSNVEIIVGDITKSPPPATLFYLYNPFGGEVLKRFEQALRGKHVKIIFNAYHELDCFSEANGWRIRYESSTRDECQYRLAVIETI